MKRTLGISGLFVGAAIIVACSKNPPPIKASISTTPSDAGAPPQDGGPLLTNGPPPVVDAGAPVMPPFFTNTDAGTGPTAPPAMTDQAADVAIDAILAATATKNAPKMTEVASAVGRQTMKEGDHLVLMVNLEPNKCYTIIGTSLPGMVTQLDLNLLGPPFYNVSAGASGKTDKALPIIAKGTAALCPISPVALPYKLDAIATKGAGRIGVKVYVRAK